MRKSSSQDPQKTAVGLPPLFIERLGHILPETVLPAGLAAFERDKLLSVRINTLKTARPPMLVQLQQAGVQYREVPWYPAALTIQGMDSRQLGGTEWVSQGLLYAQGLSSMLPVIALDPRPGERVLDICAAPGSKTTQMAAHMANMGRIAAVESVKGRFYRLRSVAQLLGAEIVECKMSDGRRYRDRELFDRILADVPCSSEGRFRSGDPETFAYWSLRKVREMEKKQKGLLMAAGRLLKPGGVMVYSTCTFSPEENEGVVDWFLRKTQGEFSLVPVPMPVTTYPAVLAWQKKTFDPSVRLCCRVLPAEEIEGFFIAKFRRNER